LLDLVDVTTKADLTPVVPNAGRELLVASSSMAAGAGGAWIGALDELYIFDSNVNELWIPFFRDGSSSTGTSAAFSSSFASSSLDSTSSPESFEESSQMTGGESSLQGSEEPSISDSQADGGDGGDGADGGDGDGDGDEEESTATTIAASTALFAAVLSLLF
jgi:hypothetical protein